MTKLKNLLARFRNKKILVIGDVILDQHIRGTVSRISPEAPVPVVLQEGDATYAPGGAANVAHNIRTLGARVTILSRVGEDPEGRKLVQALKKLGISTRGIFVDRSVPTILKTRIIAQHQQVLRIDREKVTAGTDAKFLRRILLFVEKNIHSYDGIIISDYGKGMISRELVEVACRLALKNGRTITVDPKVEHFGYYRGVTAITPNRKEAENAIRNIKITQTGRRKLNLNSDQLRTQADVVKAGSQLLKYMELDALLITLGEEGMCLFEKGKKALHIHTQAQDVYDVTGAGDTVIAVFTLGLTAGADKSQAADLANFAAGIVVGKMGPVAVTRKELLEVMK